MARGKPKGAPPPSGELHSHISKQRAKSAGCCAGPSPPRSLGELATERTAFGTSLGGTFRPEGLQL
jgi:hypothetical protein